MMTVKRHLLPQLPGLLAATLAWLTIAGPSLANAARDAESEPSLAPRDFAHGRSIEAKKPGALQTLLIPMAVYTGSVEPRLADLRVFDAGGEAVPHTIRGLAAQEPREDLSEPLALFTLPYGTARAGDGAVQQSVEGFWRRDGSLRIDAKIDEKEATLRLESGAAAEPLGGRAAGYLLDTGESTRAMLGLQLELAAGDEPFVTSLRVRGSDDLVHYDELTPRATIARLEQGEHRVEISRIHFARSRHRYLEITWPQGELPLELVSARARLAPRAPTPRRFHARVKGSEVKDTKARGAAANDEPQVFLYDLGGTAPVDRMQVELTRPDNAVAASLYSAAGPEGPWHRLFHGLIFDIEHAGTRHRNDTIATGALRQRYYRLEVSTRGGGVGGRAPTLDLAWRPEQLIFVARGPAPFGLSYGRAGVERSDFDFSDLLAITQHSGRELPVESAILGRERAVADPSVLDPPALPLEPRTIALWLALILAVALVAGMSLRVLRQMSG